MKKPILITDAIVREPLRIIETAPRTWTTADLFAAACLGMNLGIALCGLIAWMVGP